MALVRALAGVIAAALLTASSVSAQTSFVDVTPAGNPLFVTDEASDFWVNAVAAADVDGDGDLDLAVLGFYVMYNESVEHLLVLFRNDGPDATGQWILTPVSVPLGGLTAGASDLAWGDYDGDGDPDLAVASEGATLLFRNDGGTLTATDIALPAYLENSSYTGAYDLRSLTWADVDNDGDLDLLVPSVFDPVTLSSSTRLLRNDGSDGAAGWRFTDMNAALAPIGHAQSAWADADGDGDLDLLLVDSNPEGDTGFIRLYRNNGGDFVGEDLLDIRLIFGTVDWGDYDADGDLDLLVAGLIQEADETFATVLRVYRNDGGAYTAITLAAPSTAPWLDIHAATWADYDSDGDMDVLVTGNFIGTSDIEGRSEVYVNAGGVFAARGITLPAPISSIGRGGTFTWLDLDGDGDLDYFIAGAYFVPGGNGLVEARMQLFRNDTPRVNTNPGALQNVAVATNGDAVTLSWDPATDDGTPNTALTYDLSVARTDGLALTAPGTKRDATTSRMATLDTRLAATNPHRLPEPGNLSAVTRWTLRGLAAGTYTWSIRAVDSAFNGGPVAQGSFSIGTSPDESLGGTATGQSVWRVRCENETTRKHVWVKLRGTDSTWDCEEAGLVIRPGDRISMLVRARADGGSPFGGSVTGQTLVRATCRNMTTRTTVTIPLIGSAKSWDCASAGLVVNAGDKIRTLLEGHTPEAGATSSR